MNKEIVNQLTSSMSILSITKSNTLYVFGCIAIALTTFGAVAPAHAAVVDWQKGVSLYPASNNDFASNSFDQSLQNAAAIHANMATFIVPYYQLTEVSSDIQSGWNTPTDASLIAGINYAHSLGMQASIKIHLSPYYGDSWEAYINPTDRTAWFGAYGTILNHYATLAASTGTEQIVIGNELTSLTSAAVNPDNTAEWQTMIAAVRTRYTGSLTYNANSGTDPSTDEPDTIGFWPQLDAIGISAYYELGDNLQSSWATINQNDIAPLAAKYKKPIEFTEVGYRSVDGAHTEPWNYQLTGTANQQEQSDDYNALFSYFDAYPYVTGINLWNWDTNPDAGGTGNTDYTIQNKLAEQTVSQWFAGAK
jgi:hypothetical protein